MSRIRAIVVLVPYLVVVLYLTLVYHPALYPDPDDRLSLVPFRSISLFWNKGGWPMAINVLGNLGVFAPLGFLFPWARGEVRRTSLKRVALAGGAVSLGIEMLQYAQGRRVADVDDVILNVVGTVLGYLVLRALIGVARLRPFPYARRELVAKSS